MRRWYSEGNTCFKSSINRCKELALGGRLYLYALAAAGQLVLREVLKIRLELERDMKLVGCRTVNELSRKNLRFNNSST